LKLRVGIVPVHVEDDVLHELKFDDVVFGKQMEVGAVSPDSAAQGSCFSVVMADSQATTKNFAALGCWRAEQCRKIRLNEKARNIGAIQSWLGFFKQAQKPRVRLDQISAVVKSRPCHRQERVKVARCPFHEYL
jgi:hypothetical protein